MVKQHRCRILLVDDHAAVRVALRNLLNAYDDLEVIGEAEDGAQAIELTQASRPDVVILDLSLPRMNGLAVASEIRKIEPGARILGLCAIQDPYTTEAFLKAGALAVISKERIDDLHPTIQRACRQAT